MRAFKRLVCRVRREEGGSASTVEAALWLPVFVIFLTLVIDVSSIYNSQSEIMRILQDANRAYAIGQLSDEDATEDYIKTAVASYSANPTVNTVLVSGIITTTVDIPATDLMPVNRFTPFRSVNITLRSQQLAEF